MLFYILLIASIVFFGGLAITVPVLKKRLDLLPVLEKLPRAKWAGIVLTGVVLLWCLPHIQAVLSPDSFFRRILYPGLFVSWILCSVYLDYLFARAFGVFCILYSYTMLHLSFSAMLSGIAFGAVFYYLVGCGGILICAKPYWLRDTIRFVMQHWAGFYLSAGICLYGVLCNLFLLLMNLHTH